MVKTSTDKTDAKISIVCPFFNEEAIIADSVTAMFNKLTEQFGDAFELILVDDGSTDGSLSTVLNTAKSFKSIKKIRVLSNPYNQGRGRALKNGIDAASAEIIITTEVDCSWGDDIALKLYDEIYKRPDLDFVIASPHLPGGGFRNVPLKRVLLSKYGNKCIRIFFENNITMNTGMTRCYRSKVIQPLFTERDGKDFHLEVLLKLLSIGFNYSEIPATITWPKQIHKSTKPTRKSSTKILNTIGSHLTFVAIARPILQFSILSSFSILFGTSMLMLAVFQMFFDTFVPEIPFLMLSGIGYFFALFFGSFAIQFFQLRELMRRQWMLPYKTNKPPSKKDSCEVSKLDWE